MNLGDCIQKQLYHVTIIHICIKIIGQVVSEMNMQLTRVEEKVIQLIMTSHVHTRLAIKSVHV